MRLFRGIRFIKRCVRPVVALGVFDGLHRGHRKILCAAVRHARRIKGTSIVVTFWPHPQKKQSLYSLQHRLKLFSGYGLDRCIVVRFDSRFAGVPAERFVRDFLVRGLGVYALFVGRNFRFGSGARGNWKLLKRLAQKYGFKVKIFDVIKYGRQTVSSTLIRSLISAGKLRLAEELLGRPVAILGTVIRGKSLGRKLGFPTANINPHHEVLPPSGIYAVMVFLGKRKFGGACYIGSRPTFRKSKTKLSSAPRSIEVHIFGFNKPLYGKDIEVRFLEKIRPDRKFSSPGELVLNIKKDISAAKRIISSL